MFWPFIRLVLFAVSVPAGAQRSDPKTGDPSQWGPMGDQRDEVRINNYARCVHDVG